MADPSVSTAVLGTLLSSFVLFAALLYLGSLPGTPAGVGWWTVAFGLHTARYLAYALAGPIEPASVAFLGDSLEAAMGILLLAGSLAFLGRRPARGWVLAACLAVTLWAAYGTFVESDFLLRSLPIYGVSGLAMILAGATFVRVRGDARRSCHAVGAIFLLWGLHKLGYPFVRPLDWFAPFGFLATQALTMMAAIGLFVLAMERLRTIAAAASARDKQRREYQSTLNRLLRISLQAVPLSEQLDRALEALLSAPWLGAAPRGGIFLRTAERLELVTQRDLAPGFVTHCAQVPLGRCACGRAALTGVPQHLALLDDGRTLGCDGKGPHGHYAVPMISDGRTLGVVLLHLRHGQARDEAEAEYLRAAADVIAGMIVRTRAEEALETSRLRLIEAQRIGRIGSWERDLDSGVAVWSDEVYGILGYAPGSVMPHADAFMARIHEQDRERVKHALSRVADKGFYEIEHRIVRPDGSLRTVAERAEVAAGREGATGKIIGTIQDITEIKAGERALLLAKEEAEAANRAKSAFLATMSHELRTPLNAVIGFSQILEHEQFGPIGARYRDYAQHIRESGEHLLSVISDILDISKVEAGQTKLAEEDLEIGDLVRRAARLLEEKARNNRLDLVHRVASGLPLLYADERAVKQVLLNLLANAVKFTPAGGEVVVEADLVGEELELVVRDTGIGIAPEDQDRIFQPFVQADNELSRRYEGTGLGLPLVKSLVALHQGRVVLDSAPGQGTSVKVRFPAARLRRRHAARVPKETPPAPAVPVALH